VRENGGQYTHAAIWVVMALARLSSGDEAMELFHLLNPINHTRTPALVATYQGEPYVVAGDVYDRAPHFGRAGWTWYTGSAGWMYRAGLESLVGLRRYARVFAIDPCIPAEWTEFAVSWQTEAARYDITVVNPDRQSRGVRSVHLDGRAVPPSAIPLHDDHDSHHVRVVLGRGL
jgi:cyclic beta-1,2-glucan synthetase